MKVINITVDKDTFQKLESGELILDVRVDEMYKNIKHEIGDMLIYSMRDEKGMIIEDRNLAFLITTKVQFETFVNRIGEQIITKDKGHNTSDDLIIVTLAQVSYK